MNDEEMVNRLRRTKDVDTPSAEALRLAVKLSGHISCERYMNDPRDGSPCTGCLGDAATIDATLQLPARNAALLLAQAFVDDYDRTEDLDLTLFVQLRVALRRIGGP